jgi:hypothetical protein
MAKILSDEDSAILDQAKRAAEADGLDWSLLSKEQKKVYRKKARQGSSPDPTREKSKKKAKLAAKEAGHSWRELTKEQRKEYLKQARGS